MRKHELALFHRMGHMVRDLVVGRERFNDVLPTCVRIEITMPGEDEPYVGSYLVTEGGGHIGSIQPRPRPDA